MNKELTFAFLVTGLFVGLLLTWQFNTDVPVPTNFPSDEIEAKDTLLKSYLDEQSYLQSKIVSLREEIEDNQEQINLHSEQASLALLEELKEDIGLAETISEGIEIRLDDSPLAYKEGIAISDIYLVQASDLRDLINILYASNADSISVNQQRIIATSPITSVGNSILINNAHTAPPYIIYATGDMELMKQRLKDQNLLFSLYQRARTNRIVFEFFTKERVVVPIYNGDLKTKYINLVD